MDMYRRILFRRWGTSSKTPPAVTVVRRGVVVAVALAVFVAAVGGIPTHVDAGTVLSAEFVDVPQTHDDGEFSFEVRFSMEPDISYRVFSTSALSISGGSLVAVSRAATGRNDRWNLKVVPDSGHTGDIVITLAATVSCDDPSAICTNDNKPLSRAISVTVVGSDGPEPEDNEELRESEEAPQDTEETSEIQGSIEEVLVAWSAEMAVAEDSVGGSAVLGFSQFSSTGSITNRTFQHGAELVRVYYALHMPSSETLYLGMDGEFCGDLTLMVDGQSFATADATVRQRGLSLSYSWPAPDIDWTVGDTIEIALTEVRAQPGQLQCLGTRGYPNMGFDPSQTRYNIRAAADTAFVTVGATADGADVEILTVRADGELGFDDTDDGKYTPGHQTRLSDHNRDTLVVVNAGDNTQNSSVIQNAYVIHIAQSDADPNADLPPKSLFGAALGTLTVTGAVLDTPFNPDTFQYRATAPNGTEQITIYATPTTGADAVVTPADADPETDGHQINLAADGSDRKHTRSAVVIAVRSADTNTLNAYTINILTAADATEPEVSISGPDDPQTGPFSATFTWSEPVTDFTSTDITLTHGTLSDFTQDSADPLVWTATLTPPDDFKGSVAVTVPAQAATDGTNTNSQTQHSFQVNTRGPVVSFEISPLGWARPGYVRGNFWVHATFSQSAYEWDPSTVVVDNARILGHRRVVPGQEHRRRSFTVKPANEGPITISTRSGAVQNRDGDPSPAATVTVIYDVTHPTVELSSSSPADVQGPFDVEFVFSEPVNGLGIDDIDIANGTLSSLTHQDNTYRVTVTPVEHGRITVSLPFGATSDRAGNGSKASRSLTRFYVPSATAPGGLIATPGENRFTVQWDEPTSDPGNLVSGYRVEWKKSAHTWNEASFAMVPTNGREHVAAGLHGTTPYDVRVAATYGEITGPWAQTTTTPTAGSPEHASTGLETLTLDGATLNTAFKPTTRSYSARTNSGVSRVTVAATPTEANAQVAITPADTDSETAGHQIDLVDPEPGHEQSGTTVEIAVVSVDDSTPVSYTVTVESPAVETSTDPEPDGTPKNLRIVPSYSTLVVGWQESDTSAELGIDSYVVQWRDHHGSYSDTRRAIVTDLQDLVYTITGVHADTDYVVQITSRNGEEEIASAVAEASPITVRDYIEQNFVEPLEADFPWVRQVWDLDYPIVVRHSFPYTGAFIRAPSSVDGFPGLWQARDIYFRFSHYTNKDTVVHELAHGLTIDHRAPEIPGPIGISWLYAARRFDGCFSPAEILATMITRRTTGTNDDWYLTRCKSLLDGRTLDAHAQTTIDSVLEGEIPQWFYDHYQGDEPALDLDSLWMDVRTRFYRETLITEKERMVAYHMRDLFGGFCSLAEASTAVDSSGALEQGNPWVDGGCVRRRPQNLSLTAAPGEMTASWQAPLYQTTPAVTEYVVQWRTAGQDYDTTRSALVTLSSGEMSHRITDLADGTQYFVRVAAVNAASQTVFTDDDGHSRLTEATAVAGGPAAPLVVATTSGDAQVTLRWDAPVEGGPEVTGYVVQWKSGTESYDNVRRLILDNPSERSATVTGLINGTGYTLRVAAMAGEVAGVGVENTISAGLPDAPDGLQVSADPRAQSLHATWNAASGNGSDITGYVVQWRFGGDRFSSSRELIVEPDALSQTIENLVGDKNYDVRIMATNAHGRSAPSATHTARTSEPVDTSAPVVHISVPKGVQAGPFTVTFTWNEWVSDFSADDVTVSGGTLSNFAQNARLRTWTATVKPSADFQGNMTITVRGGAATDGRNRSTSRSHDVKIDTSTHPL